MLLTVPTLQISFDLPPLLSLIYYFQQQQKPYRNRFLVANFASHSYCRDTLLQHQDTDNDQEIEMCSPMQLVRSPQASLFADRHPFAKPPAACPDPQPFCNFSVSSFDAVPLVVGTASGSSSVPARSHHPHHHPSYDQPVVPEPIKVYRKSPFLPRKKASPESTISGSSQTPKKESKLSTLGVCRERIRNIGR